MGKVCKVEKVRSTFHTFHDYLNFYGEKKDDGLLTIYLNTKSNKEYMEFKKGNSWKNKLQLAIDKSILKSKNYEDFLKSKEEFIENLKTKVSKDIVYVDDGNGKMIPVEIAETIYYNSNYGMVPMSFSPLAKIGETRSYTVKVSNEMMGIPGTVGTVLSFVAKKAAAQVVSKAIAAKLGAGFIPGLNFVTWALGVAA